MIDVTELIAKGRIQDILDMQGKHLGADKVCRQITFHSKLIQCYRCRKLGLLNDTNLNDFVCKCGSTRVGMERKTSLLSDVFGSQLEWFSLDQSFKRGGVKRLRENITYFTEMTLPEFRWMYRKVFFKELNFQVLDGYTGPLHTLFDDIDDNASFSLMKQVIWENLIEGVLDQLDNNGSTLKFDVDLLSTYPDIAARILPVLLNRRKEQIENLELDLYSDPVDVMPLKSTYYGMKMLLAFENRLPDNLERKKVQVIKQNLQDAGFDIHW